MQISGLQPGNAKLAGSFKNYVEIYLQVFGAATFFVGVDRGSLENPSGSGVPGGLAFTQANTNPPYKLTWIGDLWIITNAPGSVIEITPTIPPPESSSLAQAA